MDQWIMDGVKKWSRGGGGGGWATMNETHVL